MSNTPCNAGNNPNYSLSRECGTSFLLFNIRLALSSKNPSIRIHMHTHTSLPIGCDTPKFGKIIS